MDNKYRADLILEQYKFLHVHVIDDFSLVEVTSWLLVVLHDISIYRIDIECEPKTDYE